jgi:transposase
VSASLDEHGFLYVGDCKMAALGTRVFIQNSQDYYLCPLSEIQVPAETLETYLQPVWSGEQTILPIQRENTEGQLEKIAEGYEQKVILKAGVDGKTLSWTERRLIVRSLQQARSSEEALRTRLAKAQAELLLLNEHKQGKKQIGDCAGMQSASEKVLQHYRVEGLLKLNIAEQRQERQIRAYGAHPTRTEIERTVSLQAEIDEPALAEAIRWLGWRVYATNQPQDMLPLDKAILAYREEYLVERGFGRLKGKPLSLSPMYLQSDERATGLVRLLSIGLRMLTLIEHRARQRLAELKEKMTGLYAGNPKRATDRPTAETLLEAFKGIYLSVVVLGEQVLYHVTPLSDLQERILSLLDFPVDIYTQLVTGFQKPPGKMTEP